MTKEIINTYDGNTTISTEKNFATLFASHSNLLLASNSIDLAGSIFEINKSNDFIQFRLLELTSKLDDQNMLNFCDAQSFIVSSPVFDKLVDAYRGDNLITLLTKVIDACPNEDLFVYDSPQDHSIQKIISGEAEFSNIDSIDTIIETILEVSQNYSIDVEYILINLLDADQSSWRKVMNGSLDWLFDED